MAWIESHQELWRHPKTRRLARLLGVSIPTAVGHLHGLWYWAIDFAQDGYLSAFDAEDIADAVLWEGDPGGLLDALINSGFVENTDSGLFIHDWWDYAGRLIDRRKADAERKRTSRGKINASADNPQDIQRTSDGQPKDGERSPSLPYSTGQDPTVQDKTKMEEWENGSKSAEQIPLDAVKVEKSDSEISEFIHWYFVHYEEIEGEPHPILKAEQRRRVHDTLLAFCDANGIDSDDLQTMATSFFDEVEDSDHNINHFATEGILEIRFYATLY